jgi:glycosyltransferase involved in cell wall biosynthesis
MKIGIDGIVLRGRDAGTLRYFDELVCGLAEVDNSNEYVIFQTSLRSHWGSLKKNFTFIEVPHIRFLPPILRQQFFRAWHSTGKLDLLHSPVSVLPLFFRTGKTIMTVFDLTSELYPATAKWTGRLWWKVFGRAGIARADDLIAISESTKHDLCSVLNIVDERIRVIYPCASAIFRPIASPQAIAAKYGIPEKYVLYVGTLQRRKNIAALIRAFALAKRVGAFEHTLVIAGEFGWHYRDIFQTVEELGLGNQVIFTGYVADEDLPSLYSGADLFVFLSQYEGFGFPVLEAMACGTPVLVSNASSLPEIAGDAGVLVPPNDIERTASEIARLLSDQDLRQVMSLRGLERAELFSRERFTRATLEMYNQATKTK